MVRELLFFFFYDSTNSNNLFTYHLYTRKGERRIETQVSFPFLFESGCNDSEKIQGCKKNILYFNINGQQ